MADARVLLRQQRAARRIDHPFAAYSDAGKLLCTLCHESIKTESLWEQHLKSALHRQNAQKSKPAPASAQQPANGDHLSHPSDAAAVPHIGNKRKHDSDEEEEPEPAGSMDEDAVRRKRSKTGMNEPARSGSSSSGGSGKDSAVKEKEPRHTQTPPSLARRTSATPSQGVELQIPSRPATPHHRERASSGSTLLGPSPLILEESKSNGTAVKKTPDVLSDAAAPIASGKVDEDEWAAFEADIAAASAPYSEDAVISAPAMTADEAAAAAKSEEEAREARRLAAEKDLADDKEDATRALETEFEEMEELEARVRKLKERREALRAQEKAAAADGATKTEQPAPMPPKQADGGKEDEDEDDDDEDDDEDDDFMGFRYR